MYDSFLLTIELHITCPLKNPFLVGFGFMRLDLYVVLAVQELSVADQASLEFTELSSCFRLCAGIKVVLLHSPSCLVVLVLVGLVYVLFPVLCKSTS